MENLDDSTINKIINHIDNKDIVDVKVIFERDDLDNREYTKCKIVESIQMQELFMICIGK